MPRKMVMDISQLVELWGGLSPRLVKAATKQEFLDDRHVEESRVDIGSKEQTLCVAENGGEEETT